MNAFEFHEANETMARNIATCERDGIPCHISMNGKQLTWDEWYSFLGYTEDNHAESKGEKSWAKNFFTRIWTRIWSIALKL